MNRLVMCATFVIFTSSCAQQYGGPNCNAISTSTRPETIPEFDAARAKLLYVDTDVSRLKLAATAAEMAKNLRPWRAAMNEAVRKSP